MTKRALLVVLALVGCSDDDVESELDPNEEKIGVASCAVLSPQDCQAESAAGRCAVITGAQLNQGAHCTSDAIEVLGCGEYKPCTAAITYARESATSQIYEFTTGCLPAGWASVVVETAGRAIHPCNQPSACESKGQVACGSDSRCAPIMGAQYNQGAHCTSDAIEFIGCRDNTLSCDLAITYARGASSEQIFQVSNGCLPKDWSRVIVETAGRGAIDPCNAPLCRTLDATACAADSRCVALTGKKLDATKQCVTNTAEHVGCWPIAQGCPPAILYAKDNAGSTYEIASGCVPAGFTRVDSDSTFTTPTRCN